MFNTSILSLVRMAVAISMLALSASFDPCCAQEPKTIARKVEGPWKDLIVGKTLEGWEKTNFGGEGEVEFNEKGELIFETGQPLTGINYKKEFPKENFEIRFEANRMKGSDFLVGLTFPVGEEHCSLICGGWGGGLIGISSIDGNDASENATTQWEDFKNEKWYRFVVHVDEENIIVQMEGKEIIRVDREGKSFSVRGEVRPSRPLGYCTFASKVAMKGLQYRTIEKSK